MTRFVTAYETACPGFTLNYTSSGSGAGVSEFIGGQTDFGGSDSPLNAEKGEVDKAKARCGGADAWNLPTVFGPIAVTYNVAGVDGLVWTDPPWPRSSTARSRRGTRPRSRRSTRARPCRATRSTWSSAATSPAPRTTSRSISTRRPTARGARAPARRSPAASARVRRATRAPRRRSRAPQDRSPTTSGPTPRSRACRSPRSSPRPVLIRSKLTAESAGKSIDGVKIKGEGNDLVLDTSSFYKPTEAGAYPIMLATYEIVCSKYAEAEVGHGRQGVPDSRRSATARRAWRTTATSRSPTPSRPG